MDQFEDHLAGSRGTPKELNAAIERIKEQEDITAEGTTMRILAAIAISLFMLASGALSQTSKDQEMISITRSGSQPPRPGPADNLTGSVRIDSSFQANAPARMFGARAAFEPGARTAWHTHPLGHILIVTTGTWKEKPEIPGPQDHRSKFYDQEASEVLHRALAARSHPY